MDELLENAPSILLENTPAACIVRGISAYERPYSINYKPWQVERLLNESAALIDRCVDMKRVLDELWVAWANHEIQLLSDTCAKTISEREVEDKVDTFRWLDLKEQKKSLLEKKLSDYVKDFAAPNTQAFTLDKAIKNAGEHCKIMGAGKNGGEAAPAGIATFQTIVTAFQYGERLDSLNRQISYEEKATKRNERSRENATAIRDKRLAYSSKEGPLDYLTRITRLTDNLIIPYLVDVQDRCKAAFTGLQNIYGRSNLKPLPNLDLDAVEKYANWIREQVVFLAKFGHLDQGFTVNVSLTENLENPIICGEPSSFYLDSTLFEKHSYCRLRGLSVFIETENRQFPETFRVMLKVPKAAKFINEDCKPFSAEENKSMPECILGRVTSRFVAREPEVCGTVSLMNASPWGGADEHKKPDPNGLWEITICPVSNTESKILDVQLELSLVGRPLTCA